MENTNKYKKVIKCVYTICSRIFRCILIVNVQTIHLFSHYSVLCTDTLIHRIYASLLRPGRWLIQAQVCWTGPACGRCFMKASCLIHSERGEGGRPLGGHTQGGQRRLLLSLTLAEEHLGSQQGQRDVFVRTPPPRSLPGYRRRFRLHNTVGTLPQRMTRP